MSSTAQVFFCQRASDFAATGTGNLVLQTSPTLITPNIGDATGVGLNISAATAGALEVGQSGLLVGGLQGASTLSSQNGASNARFAANTNGPVHRFGKSRGTFAAAAAVVAGDRLFQIEGWGDDASANGNIPVNSVILRGQVEGTVSTGIVPANFNVSTMNSGGTFAERLRLHASGGLSLGNTTDPGATNLSVTGKGTFNYTSVSGVYGVEAGGGILGKNFDSGANPHFYIRNTDTGGVVFYNSGSTIPLLSLTDAGSVGIGVLAPVSTKTLDITTSGSQASVIFHTSASGITDLDGFEIGIADGNFSYIWCYENLSILFGTNNNNRATIDNGGLGVYSSFLNLASIYTIDANNNQYTAIQQITENVTIAAAASTTSTIQIPTNSFVIGVSVRVTTAIPAPATSFSVGVGGATTRYGTGISVAINTTAVNGAVTAGFYGAATPIVITPAGGTPATNVGRVRLTIHFIQIAAPSS
jgi:hypothetical protein